jgi:hypothetical protein
MLTIVPFKNLACYTGQKGQRLCLVPLIQHESILSMTDTASIASFLPDFYVLSTPASLEYVENAGMCVTLLLAYSCDADVDNT